MEEKLSVLVVDDDREIVESIAIYLSRENLTIYKAYDGLQALDIVAAHTIHLILMDIMMPKMDGIKAMLKLRERNNIPIILIQSPGADCTSQKPTAALRNAWHGTRPRRACGNDCLRRSDARCAAETLGG